MKDPGTGGGMVRVRGTRRIVDRHLHGTTTSRSLDPQLHTHAVLANMAQRHGR